MPGGYGFCRLEIKFSNWMLTKNKAGNIFVVRLILGVKDRFRTGDLQNHNLAL